MLGSLWPYRRCETATFWEQSYSNALVLCTQPTKATRKALPACFTAGAVGKPGTDPVPNSADRFFLAAFSKSRAVRRSWHRIVFNSQIVLRWLGSCPHCYSAPTLLASSSAKVMVARTSSGFRQTRYFQSP